MKVYVNGVVLESSDVYGPAFFLEDFARVGVKQFDYFGRKRVIFVEKRAKNVVGCVFSNKNQSDYLTVEQDSSGRYNIRVETTAGGRPMFDFTLFAFRLPSCRGLYSQYWGSGGASSFGSTLSVCYNQLASEARNVRENEMIEDELDPTSRPLARELNLYQRARLKATLMLKDPSFTKELKKLARIKSFDYTEPFVKDPRYTRVKKDIKLVKQRCTFKIEEQDTGKIRSFLNSFVKSEDIKEGTVKGTLPNGDDFPVHIDMDTYCFAKEDYKNVLNGANFTLPGLESGPLMQRMVSIIDSRPELFA